MSVKMVLLDLLDEAYDRQSWHGPNLRGSLRGVKPADAEWRPAKGRHSIRELVIDAGAIWKYRIRRRLSGDFDAAFSLPGNNWFTVDPTRTWRQDLALLAAEHDALRQTVERFSASRLLKPILPNGATAAYLVRGIAAHDLYHAGQIPAVEADGEEPMTLLDLVKGATFDDFLFTPQLGVVPSRDPSAIDLSARFTSRLTLQRPIVSANMDTITRSAMAVVLAEEGGIGIIDRGFRAGDIAPQVTEVLAVKRTQHGIIMDPHAIGEDALVGDAKRVMRQTGVGTLAVVDSGQRLKGLLTERDVRFVPIDVRVAERMTPRDRLIVHTGLTSPANAESLMAAHKIKKLPLIAPDGTVIGLVTAKDLLKHRRHPFATRDERGRLRVGAAVGATGDYLERAAEVLRAGADVLVIDIAHGALRRDGEGDRAAPRDVRRRRSGRGQRRHGRRGALPARSRRERNQGRHRTRRRLHDAPHHATSACRRSRRSCRRRSRLATACRSSPTAASSGTAGSRRRSSSAATP
ncbi:MAG: IMP dehydrogenase [Vicinamibacterales bacterium]